MSLNNNNPGHEFKGWKATLKACLVIWVMLSLLSCGGGSSEDADTQPPEILALVPVDNGEITDVLQVLTFQVSDPGGAGVDPGSLVVTANGMDRSSEAILSGDRLTLSPTPQSRWERGVLDIRITLSDKAGNQADSLFTYTILLTTQSLPRAVPASGEAPLKVTFYPDVSVDAVIETYEWDFDNDGVYDVTDAVGRAQVREFQKPGEYIVKLKITDNEGIESVGEVTVTVENGAPMVSAEAQPSNGSIPLTVRFTVSASDNEGIASYAWDFDGDGTDEETGLTTGNATHVYQTAGVFRPAVTVTDTAGKATRLQVPSIEVRAGPQGTPSVQLVARPSTGKAPLAVQFTANASDPDGLAATMFEWDFDGDNTIDQTTGGTERIVNHEYSAPGDYYARVKVTMDDGGIAEDVVRVQVQQEISLSLSSDTLDVDNADTTTIHSILGGATTVSLVIEDSQGRVVRTLVDRQQRDGGSYDDIWDGKNDQGGFVGEGQYRVILLHGDADSPQRFDLGLTTGGRQSNPTATYDSSFQPFAGNPLEIDYSLNQASEVTAFMGYLGAGTRRLFTFFHRKPQGRGSHRIIWNGENEDGVLIQPPQGSSGFLVGMFAYSLPDNAIVVSNRVQIDGLHATPPILTPSSVTPDATPAMATVEFDLSRDARITHTVNNAETGELIYRRVYEMLQSGVVQLTWDGKTDSGEFAAPGYYRHGITAVDGNGNKSITQYTMQRLYY